MILGNYPSYKKIIDNVHVFENNQLSFQDPHVAEIEADEDVILTDMDENIY